MKNSSFSYMMLFIVYIKPKMYKLEPILVLLMKKEP